MKPLTGKSGTNLLIGIILALAIAAAVIALVTTDRTAKKGSRLGPEFGYDLTEQKKIDPALILYREAAPVIKTALQKPTALAVGPHDRIYVAGDREICVFDSQAKPLPKIKLTSEPRCLAVAHDGTIYLGIQDHIEVYNDQGKKLAAWESLGDKAVLTAVAVGKNDVFVTDAGNRVVVRYDKSGRLLSFIGKKDPDRNIPGFNVPSPYFDLAIAPDGLLRVVNPGNLMIEAYTFDGDREFWWGKPSTNSIDGFSGCCNPVNFALLPNDEGFVTAEKGLTRIKIYDPAGKFVGVVAGPETFAEHDRILSGKGQGNLEGGLDVAVDSQNRVLVLDPLTDEIRIFTRKTKNL